MLRSLIDPRLSPNSNTRLPAGKWPQPMKERIVSAQQDILTYKDIRAYLDELDKRGLLQRVTRQMNNDNEVMPLVRWQFRGLQADQRKGWLFENLTDSRGRTFDGKVAVAIDGASLPVYASAMGLPQDSDEKTLVQRWIDAQNNPIKPIEVDRAHAPIKEVVITGDEVITSGGIDKFPVTVTNPGTDVSANYSCPIFITKDPETGVYNVGTYRVMVKAADRAGVMMMAG